jgi:transcriptional regulator with XRE-family HTH domain
LEGFTVQPIGLENLGEAVRTKRGAQGIRAAAADVGISPATLSRIENGHLPDLETFRRLCVWLEADPASILGFENSVNSGQPAEVHFRKQNTQHPETLRALAEMIATAQLALDNGNLGA